MRRISQDNFLKESWLRLNSSHLAAEEGSRELCYTEYKIVIAYSLLACKCHNFLCHCDLVMVDDSENKEEHCETR
jgi:hypothetical protein